MKLIIFTITLFTYSLTKLRKTKSKSQVYPKFDETVSSTFGYATTNDFAVGKIAQYQTPEYMSVIPKHLNKKYPGVETEAKAVNMF
jgi:hypothetical protein